MEKQISEDIALEICDLVRERNRKKKLSLAKGQCWGCIKHSTKKNDIRTGCLFSSENKDNRGYQLVNKIFDSEY